MRIHYVPFMKRHIDLDHITSVGDAHFLDRMGSGGYFVMFDISFILHDKPQTFLFNLGDTPWLSGTLRFKESSEGYELLDVFDNWVRPQIIRQEHLACVDTLKTRIKTGIIQPWRGTIQ